jgi:hypothetical protein
VVEVWHAAAVDQVNIGYQVDIPDSPALATAGEVYWRIKYRVITANAFAVWNQDAGAGMNKFIDFGSAGTSRIITNVTNNQDNYNYLLSGSCAGITGVGCNPADWGISGVGTNWNHATINDKYGAIGAGWGVSEEGVGPGLIGVDGLTGIPSGGWICFQFYAKSGTVGNWELRMWRSAMGVTQSFASPTARHVGGDGAFESRDLANTNWNGTWYLGGFVGEPIVEYHYQVDDFEISTGFDANYCASEAVPPDTTPRRLRFKVAGADALLTLAVAMGLTRIVMRRRFGA